MKINYDVSQGIIDDCCNESFGLLDGGKTGEFHVKKQWGVCGTKSFTQWPEGQVVDDCYDDRGETSLISYKKIK